MSALPTHQHPLRSFLTKSININASPVVCAWGENTYQKRNEKSHGVYQPERFLQHKKRQPKCFGRGQGTTDSVPGVTSPPLRETGVGLRGSPRSSVKGKKPEACTAGRTACGALGRGEAAGRQRSEPSFVLNKAVARTPPKKPAAAL